MRPAYRRRTCIGYGPRTVNTEWKREYPIPRRPGLSRSCIYDGHRRRYTAEPRYLQDVRQEVCRRQDPPCFQDARILCDKSSWFSCPYTQGDELTAQAEVPIGINLANMRGQKDLHLTLNLKLVPECQMEDESATKVEKSNGHFFGFLPCFGKNKNKTCACKPDMGMILKEMCGNLLAINDAIKEMKMDQDNFIIRRDEQNQLLYNDTCHAYMRKRGGRDEPPNNGGVAHQPSKTNPPNAFNNDMRMKDEDKDVNDRDSVNDDRDHVVDDTECSIDDNKSICDKKKSSYKEKPIVKNKSRSHENNKPIVEKKKSSKEKKSSVHKKKSSYENTKPVVDLKRSSKEHKRALDTNRHSDEEITVTDKSACDFDPGKPIVDKKRSSKYDKKADHDVKESKEKKKKSRKESKTNIEKPKKTKKSNDKKRVKKGNTSDDEIILKKRVEPSCSYEIPQKLSMHGSEHALKVLTTSSTTFHPAMHPSQHKINKLLSILTERPSFTMVEKMSDDYILGKSKDPGQNKFNPYRKYYCDEDKFAEALGFNNGPDWSVTYRKPEPRLDRTSSERMNLRAHRSRSKSSKSSATSRASDKSTDSNRLDRSFTRHTERFKQEDDDIEPPLIRRSLKQVIDPRSWYGSPRKKENPKQVALFEDSESSDADILFLNRKSIDRKKDRRRKNRVMKTYRMEDEFYATRSYAVDLLRRIEDTLEDDCF